MSDVVIGMSPFNDTSIGVGPFRSHAQALKASERLIHLGWNVEIVELSDINDIDAVENDEG